MNDGSLTISFTVEQTPEEAFAAICDVRTWWTGRVDGATDALDAEFTYRYENQHRSVQRITEFVPGKRIVWHVLDSHLDFIQDTTEWTGTDITFDISSDGPATEIRFTHRGLVPQVECFDVCSNAWGLLVGNQLRALITSGAAS